MTANGKVVIICDTSSLRVCTLIIGKNCSWRTSLTLAIVRSIIINFYLQPVAFNPRDDETFLEKINENDPPGTRLYIETQQLTLFVPPDDEIRKAGYGFDILYHITNYAYTNATLPRSIVSQFPAGINLYITEVEEDRFSEVKQIFVNSAEIQLSLTKHTKIVVQGEEVSQTLFFITRVLHPLAIKARFGYEVLEVDDHLVDKMAVITSDIKSIKTVDDEIVRVQTVYGSILMPHATNRYTVRECRQPDDAFINPPLFYHEQEGDVTPKKSKRHLAEYTNEDEDDVILRAGRNGEEGENEGEDQIEDPISNGGSDEADTTVAGEQEQPWEGHKVRKRRMQEIRLDPEDEPPGQVQVQSTTTPSGVEKGGGDNTGDNTDTGTQHFVCLLGFEYEQISGYVYAKSEILVPNSFTNNLTGLSITEIKKGNVPVRNGVLHIVDGLMCRINETIVDALTRPKILNMKQFARFAEFLNPKLMVHLDKMESDLTVFIPTNAALRNSFLRTLKHGDKKMEHIYTMHIVEGFYDYKKIKKLKATSKTAKLRAITKAYDVFLEFYFIANPNDPRRDIVVIECRGHNATVELFDIRKTNGVVHLDFTEAQFMIN
uniref:FAS1 domain-containing protein n=1 Tax=Glossina pallidipes TaxID=7398 RepID=A0A1A9ZYK9_GLOPL